MLKRLTMLAFTLSILLPSLGMGQGLNFSSENGEYPVGLAPTAVAAGDIDGDGHPDIVVANGDGDNVSVFAGTSTGEFIDSGVTYTVGQAPFAIVLADVDGKNGLDVITTDENEDAVSVLLNDGRGLFAAERRFDTGSSPEGLVVRDLDGDSKLDIATVNNFDETVTILKGSGDGNFNLTDTYVVGAAPMGLTAADVDGDSKLDLVVSNTAGGTDANGSISFLKGNGNGGFVLRPEFVLPEVCGAVGCLPIGTEVADFNGDSVNDLVVINQDGDSVGIYMGNGDFTFKTPTIVEVSSTPAGSVLADFNGDGKLDIATTGSFDNFVSILLGSGTGTFAAPVDFEVGETPMGIAVGRFNGDSKLDIVVANLDSETITVLLSVAVCSGDCNANKTVEASDLVNLIELALGSTTAPACTSGDTDSSGGITVEEIVGAVNTAAAGGCAL